VKLVCSGIGNESLAVQHQAARKLYSILMDNRDAVLKAEIDPDSPESKVISKMVYVFTLIFIHCVKLSV
jgi:hypothetical protein